MKKISILILLFSLMVTINAQKEKLIGSWLMVRAEIGGEIQEPYFIMDYKENGKTVAMEMELGTWKLDESSNTIIMESAFDKDFNGEAKIQKLTEEELIVIKDGAKLFYTRFNSDAIAGNNKKSKLFGIWETKNAEDETVLIKFEEPDSFVEITSGEGVTSRAAGSWVFNPEENYVIFIGFSHLLRGKNQIVELTEETLVLESNGTKINAKKTNSNSQIERLTFEYEDFPEEEMSSENNLPWLNFYEMVEYLNTIKFIKYKSGSLIEEMNILKPNMIMSKIEADTEKQSVMFSNLAIEYGDTMQYSQNYKGGLSERYNDFFPKEEPSPYRIIGVEKVTVPAGTFECTVVEGMDSDDKIKYWMINDKPGIYAKYIIEGISVFDDLKYMVYELEEIK